MDKMWIVLLFLCVFLIGNAVVKKIVIRFLNSADNQSAISAIAAEKDDPKVFWEKEGFRREPENAEFVLPEKDFFENEKTEISENFEDEFSGLSDSEAREILLETGLFEKEGERD